jgi:hypothetical protein
VGWLAGPWFAARSKSGIFLSKWHKKVAGLRGKHFAAGDHDHCTGNMILRQNAIFASRAAGFPVSTTKGIKNVESIVVLCSERPATGPLSGGPAS